MKIDLEKMDDSPCSLLCLMDVLYFGRMVNTVAHMPHLPTTARRCVTGPSTVGPVGARSPARITCVAAGITIGRSSEMRGSKEAMVAGKSVGGESAVRG